MICDFPQALAVSKFATLPLPGERWRDMDGGEIERRLKALGKTKKELAFGVGISPTAMSRIVTGERKDLKAREVDRISAKLEEWEAAAFPGRGARAIPLLGYAAAGGEDHIAWSFDRPLDWVEPPPMRDTGAEVVAIRVSGDSMEPRLFSGEVIYVGIGVAPARGGDAVLEFRDSTAVVKSYERRREGRVFVRQYNPERELSFAQDLIKNVHAVLWRR